MADIPELTEPLCERLTDVWQKEDDVVSGLSFPNMRVFWATQAGLATRQKRLLRKGWWIKRA